MKNFRLRCGGWFFIWLLVTLLLSYFWLNYPDIFPVFPEPLALWLVKVSGAANAEDVADLEVIVSLVVMGVVSALMMCLGRKFLARKA